MSNSFIFPFGEYSLRNGDIAVTDLKLGLYNSTFVPVATMLYADEGGAADFVDGEISATNYTGGHGGSGRKSLTSETWAYDTARRVVGLGVGNLTWTSLGNGSNDTIVGGCLLAEAGTDDTETILVAALSRVAITTSGSNFQWTFSQDGPLRSLLQTALALAK